MEEKKSNIRLVKTGGRRVTKNTTEYGWDDFNRNNEKPRRTKAEMQKRVQHQKKQKAKRLKQQRIRALTVLILSVVTVSVILFLTPLFNIKTVTVEGNRIVSSQTFQEMLKPLVGENLFRSGSGKIRKTLKANSYIDTVEVQKKWFPPSVNVKVTEYVPAAMMRAEGATISVNSELRVLSDDGKMIEPVPVVSGISVKSFKVGEILKTDDKEKKEALEKMLSTIEATEIMDKIIEINVNDISNITMNYDDRIDVLCGSVLDMERKIRLFKETITSNALSDNSQGTMNLSEVGKALYTPERVTTRQIEQVEQKDEEKEG